MGHSVVCISRQEGTRAPEIALAAAEQLGFRLIDEDIVARAAAEAGVECEVIADLERGRSALVRLIEEFGAAGMGAGYLVPIHEGDGGRQPAGHELRGLIRSVIEEFAAEGKAVILAHAASLALAERDDVLVDEAEPELLRRSERYLRGPCAFLARDADDVVSHDRRLLSQ